MSTVQGFGSATFYLVDTGPTENVTKFKSDSENFINYASYNRIPELGTILNKLCNKSWNVSSSTSHKKIVKL